MVCVAWMLRLNLQPGPVMLRRFVSAQINTTANGSVCNWSKKGNNRQKQLSDSWATAASSSLRLRHGTLSWKKWPLLPFLNLLQISCSVCGPGLFLCSEAWIPDFGNVLLLSTTTAAWFWGWGSTSLDVAVVIRAVGLWHIHLPHGVTHMVHPILARRHALIDAVQALRLLKARDLVLGREPADGWEGKHTKRDQSGSLMALVPQRFSSNTVLRFSWHYDQKHHRWVTLN